MSFLSFQNRFTARRTSAARSVFGLAKLIVVLAIVCGIGWLLFQQTVHHQLRDRIEAKITATLKGSGLTAKLGQATFQEGKGIQLNNLRIDLANSNPSQASSRIEIYDAYIHAPATMAQLASSKLDIRSVVLRRAKLTVVRDANGKWDFEDLIESLAAFKSDSPIPVSLTDSEIRVVDQTMSRSAPITLTNVNLSALPRVHEGRTLIQIKGGFSSPAISQMEFTAYLDNQTQSWHSDIRATQAKLSGDLVSVLPPTIRAELKELQSVSGRINFDASATGKMSLDEIPTFSIKGDVDRLTIDDMRLPFPIRNVSASFEAGNAGFSVTDASGKLGLGDFSGNYWQRGFVNRKQWHCDGQLNQFNLDHNPRLRKWLPEYCKRFCAEYSPSGTSNIEFDVTDDGQTLNRRIIGELTNMSFSFVRLPYKIDNCVGKVAWIGDVCDFDVRSFSGKEVIELKGTAKGLGKQPTYEVNIFVPGELPIDQKMHDALKPQPKFAQVIRAFNPTGRLGGIGKIEKRLPGGEVKKTFDVRLKRCSILHEEFDYPIHNVVGLIHVEDNDYTFQDLSGNNSSGTVTCNGNWNPINGLNVRFLCESVPLDEQLRFALKPDLREIWNGFRPRGTMDHIRIDMKLPFGAADVDLNIEARMEKSNDQTAANYVSIHPVWFPYEINHVTGTVNIGNGEILLKDVEGNHQRTKIFCQGDGRYSDESWSVKLKNLFVSSLKVDEDLLAAVPTDLAPPIRQLNYEGLLSVSGEITIAGNSGSPSNTTQSLVATSSGFRETTATNQDQATQAAGSFQSATSSLAWDVRFDMTQAKMLIGVPVENVFGNVKLVGFYDGETAECRGDLDIDSLTIYEAQVTKIKGPIWLDNSMVAAGQFSLTKNADSSNQISPISEPVNPPESVTGIMHKGTVKLDARMESGGNNEYFLQATLTDGCLSTACREFGADAENIDGHSYAAIQLAGDYSGIHSQRGGGTIQLRDARIYELPVFLSLLKILNNRQLSRTAFDSSNIDFTVRGENIEFDRMEFIGNAISLIGNGRMNFDREIDLNFYSIMGRNRFKIPVLSELYHASSQRILWIKIDGTLENPRTENEFLPGLNQLNDSLRDLFQPREPNQLANRINRSPYRASSRFNSGNPNPNQSNTILR